MDRRELEIMLNDAFDRGIVTARAVEGIYPPAVTVGILPRQGRRRGPRGLEGLGSPTLIPWWVRMRPQALWHTHANAQPRIRIYA